MRPRKIKGKVQSTGERAEACGGSGNFIPSIARRPWLGATLGFRKLKTTNPVLCSPFD